MCLDLQLRWGLKQNFIPFQELSNGMWHTTCMQGSQGGSWLLVVKSQIGSLTPNPSFGHNLCFKYSNGSCELNLDINVSRSFQWYEEPFSPMSFDPCNFLLKIWESIGSPTPKVGTHLGMCGFIPSHSPTLLGAWIMILRLHSWPAPLQALALVASPRLGLRQSKRTSSIKFFPTWTCITAIWWSTTIDASIDSSKVSFDGTRFKM